MQKLQSGVPTKDSACRTACEREEKKWTITICDWPNSHTHVIWVLVGMVSGVKSCCIVSLSFRKLEIATESAGPRNKSVQDLICLHHSRNILLIGRR